jgi:hypothetical protein
MVFTSLSCLLFPQYCCQFAPIQSSVFQVLHGEPARVLEISIACIALDTGSVEIEARMLSWYDLEAVFLKHLIYQQHFLIELCRASPDEKGRLTYMEQYVIWGGIAKGFCTHIGNM